MNKKDDIPALFTKNQKKEREFAAEPIDSTSINSQALVAQGEQAVDALLSTVLLLALPSPSVHFH